jgi:hypothetical protein
MYLSQKFVTKWFFVRCKIIMRKNKISLPATIVLTVVVLIAVFSRYESVQLAGICSSWKQPQTKTKSVGIVAAGKPIWHVIPRLLLTGR